MPKSRKNRKLSSSLLKSMSSNALGKGLESVGSTAKKLAVDARPIVERGVSTVYGTLASGVDLGTNVARRIVSTRKSSKRHHKGGRRTRRRSYRRRR